ncbi:hypothetical protein GCM10027038_10610 [Arthrobacter bambusae]
MVEGWSAQRGGPPPGDLISCGDHDGTLGADTDNRVPWVGRTRPPDVVPGRRPSARAASGSVDGRANGNGSGSGKPGRGSGKPGRGSGKPGRGKRHLLRLCTSAGTGGEPGASGALAVVCRWAGGSRRPHVCGKSPEDLAFAVPMWARG